MTVMSPFGSPMHRPWDMLSRAVLKRMRWMRASRPFSRADTRVSLRNRVVDFTEVRIRMSMQDRPQYQGLRWAMKLMASGMQRAPTWP